MFMESITLNEFRMYAYVCVFQAKENMPLEDLLALQVALLNFTSKVYPQRLDYIDLVLKFTAESVARPNYRGCVGQVF